MAAGELAGSEASQGKESQTRLGRLCRAPFANVYDQSTASMWRNEVGGI